MLCCPSCGSKVGYDAYLHTADCENKKQCGWQGDVKDTKRRVTPFLVTPKYSSVPKQLLDMRI